MTYRVGVDIGGTFTDCAVIGPDGTRHVAKSLTTPDALDEGVLESVRLTAAALGLTREALLAATEMFVHGTTQATNAILTRSGARTGLITSRGHEDNLIVGRVYSKMAGLHERDLVHSSRLRKPAPIIPRDLIIGVHERMDRDGDVVVALDEDGVLAAIDTLLEAGVEALAVAFLWSVANDAHEQRVKELLAERAPGLFTAFSAEVAPVVGEYERTATTAVTAYVGPKVVGYLEHLEHRLRAEGLRQSLLVMQASGGLTSVADAAMRPIITLDSGPTGGILGSRHMGRLYGEDNIICTDVGGTSFDVGLILDGEVPLDPEPVVAQYSLRMPKVLVNTIGSGGGSIAWLDEGGLLRVGPQSAGSTPGPACYGFGGTLPTVTDADLVLGYLDPDNFLGGRMQLNRDLSMQALAALGARLGMEPEEAALGVFRIINSQMADLIRKSTIELGHDPRECVIAAYGGAGPTHAVFYGAEAGAKAILVFADSTVFSAEGMLTCDITHTEQLIDRVASPFGPDDFAAMARRLDELQQRLAAQFAEEGAAAEEIGFACSLGMRFRGQVNTVWVPVAPGELEAHTVDLPRRFAERYAQIYGTGAVLAGAEVEVEPHRVVGTRQVADAPFVRASDEGEDSIAAVKGEREVYFEPLGYTSSTVYDGYLLRPGNVVDGPAIIERMGDSVVVPPGHQAITDGYLTLRLAASPEPATIAAGTPTGTGRA